MSLFDWSRISVVDARNIMQMTMGPTNNKDISSQVPLTLPKPPYKLVTNGFVVQNICQGQFSVCYFLSACAYCAHRQPLLLYRAVTQTSSNLFQVNLYDTNGKMVSTKVDPTLPLSLCSTSKNSSELWVSILEKGFAMLIQSRVGMTGSGYDLIEGGYSAAAMTMFNPGRNYIVSVSDLLWAFLKDASQLAAFCELMINQMNQGIAFFVSFKNDFAANRVDLKARHSYTVLEARRLGSDYVFKLYNPWGGFEWTGELSDSDVSATSISAHGSMNMKFVDDGIFLMSHRDLFARMSMLEVFEPQNKTVFSKSINPSKVVSWRDLKE